jgi:hypothetical protein
MASTPSQHRVLHVLNTCLSTCHKPSKLTGRASAQTRASCPFNSYAARHLALQRRHNERPHWRGCRQACLIITSSNKQLWNSPYLRVYFLHGPPMVSIPMACTQPPSAYTMPDDGMYDGATSFRRSASSIKNCPHIVALF